MICPVCNSKQTYLWNIIDHPAEDFKVRKCVSCLSLYRYPFLENESSLYKEDYYSGNGDFSYFDERKLAKYNSYVIRSRLKNMRKYVHSGKFLDIGCSFGLFALEASNYYQSFGLDLSEYVIQEGNNWLPEKSSVQLFSGSLTNLPSAATFTNNSFQVISLIEVAEHLKTPKDDFHSAFKLLACDGVLIIQTANMNAWQALKAGKNYHYFLPGHLTYFSANGLQKLLHEVGFKKTIEFIPVDFSLFSKLLKARGSFHKLSDYAKYFKVIYYHIKSRIKCMGKPLTSSYVIYAFK